MRHFRICFKSLDKPTEGDRWESCEIEHDGMATKWEEDKGQDLAPVKPASYSHVLAPSLAPHVLTRHRSLLLIMRPFCIRQDLVPWTLAIICYLLQNTRLKCRICKNIHTHPHQISTLTVIPIIQRSGTSKIAPQEPTSEDELPKPDHVRLYGILFIFRSACK